MMGEGRGSKLHMRGRAHSLLNGRPQDCRLLCEHVGCVGGCDVLQGAAVVRMFSFLLGPEGFQRGVEAFFNNNDGKVRFLLALALHGLVAVTPLTSASQCPH